MATFLNLLNQGRDNPAFSLVQGVQFSNQSLGNPGLIDLKQFPALLVGPAAGFVKQSIYSIAIKNTELLHRRLVSPADPTQTPVLDDQSIVGYENRFSEFGTPIFDWVKLQATDYFIFGTKKVAPGDQGLSALDTFTTPDLVSKTFGGLDFVTCMVDVNKTIDIVQTKTAGSIQGTIKEYMGSGEWTVNLTAYITPKPNEDRLNYNEDALFAFRQLPEINVPIQVESYFLNLLGITHLVPLNVSIRVAEGFVGVLQVEMNFVSDSQIIKKG